MPPNRPSRQNSKIEDSEESSDKEIAKSTFKTKDATQWMMFLSGIHAFFVRPSVFRTLRFRPLQIDLTSNNA